MAFRFQLNVGSAVPIYKQITDQVRLAVATGRLAVEHQLPSVRALAEDLVVNPNTVARAYADLSREGLLETRAGRGVFVARKRRVFTREEGWRRIEPLLDSLIGEAMTLDFSPADLRKAFETKLSQWQPQKRGDHDHE